MNKKIMSKLIVATVLAGGVNFLPVDFGAENLQVMSVAHAEVKDVKAQDVAICDFADETPGYVEKVKKIARMRAEKRARERAGFYIKSYARMANGVLTDDDISAYTSNKIKVLDVQYKRLMYQAQDAVGKMTGKIGFMYEATVTAKIDDAGLQDYIQKSLQEKQILIEQDKTLQKNVKAADKKYEDLRKNALNKTPAQVNAELEQIDSKISEQNKPAKNVPMIFSQPQKIGMIVAANMGGFNFREGNISVNGIETKMSLEGRFKDRYNKKSFVYSSGIAKFISDSDELYFHFKNGDYAKKIDTISNFGDRNVDNTVKLNLMVADVFKVNCNQNLKFYLIENSYDLAEENEYILIGKNSKEKWVKYFDTLNVGENYFGKQFFGLAFLQPRVENNTIIIKYLRNKDGRNIGNVNQKIDERGEFRFKWDEAAQWFGVEKITY